VINRRLACFNSSYRFSPTATSALSRFSVARRQTFCVLGDGLAVVPACRAHSTPDSHRRCRGLVAPRQVRVAGTDAFRVRLPLIHYR